jgi:hypothetical protein
MPKNEIDYANTIIYKIYCKDTSVNELYVGHTINFVQRKQAHKRSCTREKYYNYNCKVYKIIRENGGWDNWNMDIISFFNCKNQTEARMKEQEYFVLLKATLNSIEPFPDNSEKQIITKQENKKIEMVKNIKSTDNKLFKCNECKFSASKNSNYELHLLTKKHIKNTSDENHLLSNKHIKIIIPEKNANMHICLFCNKLYNARNSLWYHNKKCTKPIVKEEKLNKPTSEQVILLTNTIIELQKQLSNLCNIK